MIAALYVETDGCYFGLPGVDPRGEGWAVADMLGGYTCYVLYAIGTDLPKLDWSQGKQRIPQWMIDRYGYEKARRIGVVAMIGGKDKTRKRNATPLAFRDLLLSVARTVASHRRLAPPSLEGLEPCRTY